MINNAKCLVGRACEQARLPAIQLDVPVTMCESREELVWKPNAIADVDLLMYLRAARYDCCVATHHRCFTLYVEFFYSRRRFSFLDKRS